MRGVKKKLEKSYLVVEHHTEFNVRGLKSRTIF